MHSQLSTLNSQLVSPLTEDDLGRVAAINAKIPGWSGEAHYAFFKSLVGYLRRQFRIDPVRRGSAPRILVLGVYQGRDIAYLLDIAHRYYHGRIFITGVDKFDSGPCDDWPPEKRHLTWQEAGFGEPPALSLAARNLSACSHIHSLHLVPMPDADYLAATEEKFDAIYLDTSHDYATVHRQLAQVPPLCYGPDTVIAGDDYSDAGTWGVKRAVTDGFESHTVFANWIWFSTAAQLRRTGADAQLKAAS